MANKLNELMAGAGVSQRELSKRLEMPSSYINKIIRGHRLLELTELVDLATALGCSPEELIGACVNNPSPD